MSADDGLSSSGSGADAQMTDPNANDDRRDGKSGNEQEHVSTLKRKAESPPQPSAEETSLKRAKLGDDVAPQNEATSTNSMPNVTSEEIGGRHSDEDKSSAPIKTSPDHAKNGRRRATPPEPDRRRDFSQEERKRGQRLFGGLLSTLSQTTANPHQRKRVEIERRQQERAQQQKLEDDNRRADKFAKLNELRQIEQVKFDEEVMRTRHSSMIAMAHSLRTRSEPRLFYHPWQLTSEQERVIKGQMRDVEDTVDEEARDFKLKKEKRLENLGVAPQPDSTAGEPAHERSNPAKVESTNRPPPPKLSHDRDPDEKDIMVETEEDTVIY